MAYVVDLLLYSSLETRVERTKNCVAGDPEDHVHGGTADEGHPCRSSEDVLVDQGEIDLLFASEASLHSTQDRLKASLAVLKWNETRLSFFVCLETFEDLMFEFNRNDNFCQENDADGDQDPGPQLRSSHGWSK